MRRGIKITGFCHDCGTYVGKRKQFCERCLGMTRKLEQYLKNFRDREARLKQSPICRAWLELEHIHADLDGPKAVMPLDLLMRCETGARSPYRA